jgi:serine/threonine protein kinase
MTTEHHLALPDGYVLNEYRIERMLGHGGFGFNYLACEDRLQRRVAIKEYLPNDLAWREEDSHVVPRSRSGKSSYELGLRQFLHEARTLAQFSHPNIVQVLTFFEANGTAYIVMCYERGKSLHEHLKERGGTLPTPELLRLAKALMDGLGAVHEAHFLHRDLKPGNIFLRADGRPLLLDFGAARQTIGEATRSVAAVFTHGYAAPEQYHIGSKQGPSTDIYGLGAVFYHCIAGRPPPDAAERFLAHGAREPDPLRPAAEVGWGRYPEAFLSAVDQCLDVVAGRRPQSIADLRRRVFPDGVTDDEPRRRHEAPEGRASRKDRTVAMDRAATTGTVPEGREGSTGPSR